MQKNPICKPWTKQRLCYLVHFHSDITGPFFMSASGFLFSDLVKLRSEFTKRAPDGLSSLHRLLLGLHLGFLLRLLLPHLLLFLFRLLTLSCCIVLTSKAFWGLPRPSYAVVVGKHPWGNHWRNQNYFYWCMSMNWCFYSYRMFANQRLS